MSAKGPVKCVTLGRKPFNRLVGQCDDILQRNQVTFPFDTRHARRETLALHHEQLPLSRPQFRRVVREPV